MTELWEAATVYWEGEGILKPALRNRRMQINAAVKRAREKECTNKRNCWNEIVIKHSQIEGKGRIPLSY